jgi:hypothetical protein
MFFLKNKLWLKKFSKTKQQYFKIIFITSLFWILIDSFVLLFYLSENTHETDSSKFFTVFRSIETKSKSYSQLPSSSIILFNKRDSNALKKQLIIAKLKQMETSVIKISKTSTTSKVVEWFREVDDMPKNPANWPGEDGNAVVLKGSLKEQADKRFKDNQFNIVVSDLIAINRSVPDQRSEA